MPTWASRIMLTSLAPSPIARVMGCSLEALISFTICQNKEAKSDQHHWGPSRPHVSDEQLDHLSFLQRRHATTEHSAAVAADF